MYQTSGFVDEDLLAQIGVYFIPYQSRLIFRVCINLFILLFAGLICVLKLLPAAIALSVAIFFMRAQANAKKRCMQATVLRLRELSKSGKVRYSSKFNKNEILAENGATGSRSTIPYEEIAEVVLRPDIYLLVSKKGDLIFVFRNRLENEKEFLNFLFGKNIRLKAWQRMKLRLASCFYNRS